MEEEKTCDVRFLPCREESKGGDRDLQLSQVDRLRPVEGLELFQKNIDHRKKRSRSLGTTRADEFVAEVKRKSYAKLAAEIGCSKQTIANTINKDLGYSSYKKRHRMILTEGTRESRRVKAAALLNTSSTRRPNFFSQDQNSNRQNDRWICQNVDEVPVVKHTKFHSSVMVLGVISSEGDKGLKINTAMMCPFCGKIRF
ncbi:Transposable element tcb2 transposase [Caligus rogercresseyi]|uniref:Transposable element tcb2 transposase n=1 Tax=Caligus rogercresseyi TaxID=217165 RepID=A0A7T8HLQ5_CALRO|nr:Transposable element tcb2 transposase [Caligus rogercresseyi]